MHDAVDHVGSELQDGAGIADAGVSYSRQFLCLTKRLL
jgi:hypothetical protein